MLSLLRFCRLGALVVMLVPCLWSRAAAADAFAGNTFATDWAVGKQAAVRLVVDPGVNGALRLGLQFRLEPGWKTYWRAPGDAGLPATVDWSGSRNVAVAAIAWPAPTRYSLQGFETFGYEDALVLPMKAQTTRPGAAVHLAALVDYLVCRQVCLPNEAHLSLDLPSDPGSAAARPWRDLLDRAEARVPLQAQPGQAAGGIAITALTAGGVGKTGFLDVTVTARPPLVAPDIMVEGLEIGVPLRPSLVPGPDGAVILHLPLAAAAGLDLAKLQGHRATVTLVDPPRAVSVALEVTPPRVAATPSPSFGVAILVTALLGGFILNFMPCVLPVLSIKVLAVVGLSEASSARWRAGFLATAAGIVTSFLALAALLAAAKTAGMAIGWGIQFQQPVFLASLAAVTTGFAANLFGLFEIPLPSALAALLSGRTPRPPGHHSLAGSFVTGVLATVMATPCSAPFLGTAVGFGLAGGIGDIFAVFFCLGLGLAGPYLLLAAMPWLSRFLPRPGHWMLTLRRLLGLPLLATSVWLITVVSGEAGSVPALVVAILASGALILMLVARRGVPSSSLAALLFLAMPLAALSFAPVPTSTVAANQGIWQSFDPDRIPAEITAGHVVFVDATADWCLTCKANELAVLDKAPVYPRLIRPGVVAMRADWTRPDPRIAKLLSVYHRYGIPLYVVYGPGSPLGEALPEIITPDAVITALDRAAAVNHTP